MSCDICAEKFNRSFRKPVLCNCEFKCCRKCAKTYLLSKNELPHCMNCKIEWNREFMSGNFEKAFINKEYKEHRETFLLEKELSMLQATQPEVEKIIKIEEIHLKIESIREEYYKKIEDLEKELIRTKNSTEKERKKFIRRCPNGECKGFMSTSLKCGVCECFACGDCRELKGFTTAEREAHVCDPEIVKNVEAIQKDSKECPKCSSLTYKIEGCFVENTPILMWNQSVKMSQDIKIGDALIGDDGLKRTVLDTCNGEDQLYKIYQNKAENYIVNSKHILVLKFSGDKAISWIESVGQYKIRWFCRESLKIKTKNFKDTSKENALKQAEKFKDSLSFSEEIEITVSDYRRLDKHSKQSLCGFKSPKGIEYPVKHVILDPYLLGLWLGDGTHTHPGIASNDIEIQRYLLEWCEKNDAELIHDREVLFRIRRRGRSNYKGNGRLAISKGATVNSCTACLNKNFKICDTPYIANDTAFSNIKTNPFIEQLKFYNLLGNKHIPIDYMTNNRDTRLKVLAGLIDTDGCLTNNGKRITIGQVNERLASQIEVLAQSLGFIVCRTLVKRLDVKLPGVERKDYRDNHSLNISGEFLNEIPTILPRKKCVGTISNKDYFRTSIVVDPVGHGKYYGWVIDGNHRFLAKDFTVLRNCSQIFCTECHAVWDWKSRKIQIGGVIHNPEYFEYQKKLNDGHIPRNPNDIICGRELDQHLARKLRGSSVWMADVCRTVLHLEHADKPRFQYIDNFDDNLYLRISYMRNRLDKDDFKQIIQKKDKKNNKNREITNVFDMFLACMLDIFYNYLENKNEKEARKQIEVLRQYANESFNRISSSYNCKAYQIDKNLYFF